MKSLLFYDKLKTNQYTSARHRWLRISSDWRNIYVFFPSIYHIFERIISRNFLVWHRPRRANFKTKARRASPHGIWQYRTADGAKVAQGNQNIFVWKDILEINATLFVYDFPSEEIVYQKPYNVESNKRCYNETVVADGISCQARPLMFLYVLKRIHLCIKCHKSKFKW